jgi:hypothetical protein
LSTATQARLLAGDADLQGPPPRAWRRWLAVPVSLFFAYHATTLVVHNLPAKGLTRALHMEANRWLGAGRWFQITGIVQGWGMFAPNPHRSNDYMRVYVVDGDGREVDLQHDVYGRRRGPYLFYDRMAKINRRLVESKGYMQPYAAFVCRLWELEHGGASARQVRLQKMWTLVPPPEKVYRFMYYDPADLFLNRGSPEVYDCATLTGGQLPAQIRARHGFPARDADEVREVPRRTWWDRLQEPRAVVAEPARGGDDDAAGPGAEGAQ